MKTLNIVVLLFVTLSSCGQTVSTDIKQANDKPTSDEALSVYRSMTGEVCDCTFRTMLNNKPSTTLDSCHKVVVAKYSDKLQSLGYDPSTQVGKSKLSQEVQILSCNGMFSLIQKEIAARDAKKLLYKGTIVSQKKLSNGEVEIVMADTKTEEKRTFKSKSFLSNPVETNKNTLSYEMTIEYEVRQNPKNKQNEYYIKESGEVMSVGVQKVGN